MALLARFALFGSRTLFLRCRLRSGLCWLQLTGGRNGKLSF